MFFSVQVGSKAKGRAFLWYESSTGQTTWQHVNVNSFLLGSMQHVSKGLMISSGSLPTLNIFAGICGIHYLWDILVHGCGLWMLLNREFVGTWVWGGLFPSFRLKYTFKNEQFDLENGIVFQNPNKNHVAPILWPRWPRWSQMTMFNGQVQWAKMQIELIKISKTPQEYISRTFARVWAKRDSKSFCFLVRIMWLTVEDGGEYSLSSWIIPEGSAFLCGVGVAVLKKHPGGGYSWQTFTCEYL